MSENPPTDGALAEARRAIEAVLMVTDEPADPRLLAQLVEVAPEVVDELCEQLAASYDADDRGFELARVAGGWRFQSRASMSPYVERFVLEGQSARLSAAALETLAIVAYKQPISRAQVAAIRGVNVDAVMRTLHQRGYIGELARDPGPGQAVLFGTTGTFLERLGLNSLDELPSLGDFVPGPEVVEALELGLRVEPVDSEPTSEPTSNSEALSEPEPVSDPVSEPLPAAWQEAPREQVIDLRDGSALSGLDHDGDPLEALQVLADDPGAAER